MLEQLLNNFFIKREYIRDNVKMSKEYKEINECEGRIFDKLKKALDGEQLELFEKYADTTADLGAEENVSYFTAGLKAGFRLVLDLLNG